MGRGQGHVHYLHQNHSTWTPAAVIVLDSETMTTGSGQYQTEVLRCWEATHVFRRHRREAGQVSRASGDNGDQAAAAIDAWACADKSTWLYAHNVAFDLVTTGLAARLAALGWELSSRHAVSGSAPWLILHKGRREVRETRRGPGGPQAVTRARWQHTLTICDSFSLMPVPLAKIAAYAPEAKPPLPAQDAAPEDWRARCRADVDILTWALLVLMDWWEAHDLGKWSVSGAAAGWNSYRHRIGPKDVTIDPDPAAVELEHAAVYGGRRDVFRCGGLPPGRYAELDFASAYPTIAASQLLPAKRIGPLTPKIAAAILAGKCNYGMVAQVELQTDVARWPLRARGRVFYPVGRFQTVLAGPEIAEAQALGCLAGIGQGYFYAMSDHLQPWAAWCLALQAADPADVPGPVQIAAKGWGRSVCGKWAQRGWNVEDFPGPPGDDWSYEDAWVAGTDARASVCGLAGRYYLSIADQECDHEFPAILAYIEAHCRLRLARVVESAPPGAIIQCDTDGLMVNLPALETGSRDWLPEHDGLELAASLVEQWLAAWAELAAPLAMREKSLFGRAVVYGPQHAELDGRARFSGVPASAWQSGDHRWMARLWPGLAWQIRHGSEAGYVRPVQEYLVVGPYAAGWVLDDGRVRPCEAAIDASGVSDLLDWPLTRWAAAGDRLGPTQASWARGMAGDGATGFAPADGSTESTQGHGRRGSRQADSRWPVQPVPSAGIRPGEDV